MKLTPLQIALLVVVFTCVCLFVSHLFEAYDGFSFEELCKCEHAINDFLKNKFPNGKKSNGEKVQMFDAFQAMSVDLRKG